MKRDYIGFAVLLSGLYAINLIHSRYTRAHSPEAASDVIRTRSLQIVNDHGFVVARFQAIPEGYPGLLIDVGSTPIANLWVTEAPDGSTRFVINDAEARSRIELFAAKDGAAGVAFGAKTIPQRTVLGQSEEGFTFLKVNHEMND